MKCNVGGLDRRLRIIAGLAIIAAGVYYQSWFGAIGLVPLLTGVIGWCPAYLPFGLSSAKTCNCGHKNEETDK
ncbi:MAG: DUF2892 domain-containing protein [Methylophaga sp.]|nr:DUF2892 domain-containing protein [Methylophaga sp.]